MILDFRNMSVMSKVPNSILIVCELLKKCRVNVNLRALYLWGDWWQWLVGRFVHFVHFNMVKVFWEKLI